MVKIFICPICKLEIQEDLEKIHGHVRSKHYEIVLDQYTISIINIPTNWIEK